MSAAIFAACVSVAPLAGPASAAGGNRHALVVGVSDYDKDSPADLDKPVNDATAVAAKLRDRHSFDVTLLLSKRPLATASTAPPASTPDVPRATRAEIEAKWTSLVSNLSGNDVALFYFAGHGVELKGRSYLIPSDVDVSNQSITNTGNLTRTSVEFAWVLEALAERQKDHPDVIGIFVIDACRNNPFKFAPDIQDVNPVGLTAGKLPSTEIFVMYSAGIGQEALDGEESAQHSPFAEVLLDRLDLPEEPLSRIAEWIKIKVYERARRVRHYQTPAYYNQLRMSRFVNGNRHRDAHTLDEIAIAAHGDENFEKDLRATDILIECGYCPEMVVVEGSAKGPVPVKTFAIGKFEVTQREWDACVRDNVCKGAPHANPANPSTLLLPVTGVSWDDAQDFIRWLNSKSNIKAAPYRLPTEAEWEHAARSPKDGTFSVGSHPGDKKICRYANGADRSAGLLPYAYQHCSDDIGRNAAQVGRFAPNDRQLHDMHGNVWEWVSDCATGTAPGTPTAIETAAATQSASACELRLARGGSWRSGAETLITAARHTFPPTHSRATLGFRVARSIRN
jgi:formylglycine-generating enzyme required for sulfatase activity/uncharacterized caspase-like protein